jgi:DNA gyrase subunit A
MRLTRGGSVVASFPVREADEVLLVTDQGKMIRFSAGSVRFTARGAQGVRLLDVAPGEAVVSAAHIEEAAADSSGDSMNGE